MSFSLKGILFLILFLCATSMAEVMEPVPGKDGGHLERGRGPASAAQLSRPVVAPEVQDLVDTVGETNAGVAPSLDGFALPRPRNTGELTQDPGFQDLFGSRN